MMLNHNFVHYLNPSQWLHIIISSYMILESKEKLALSKIIDGESRIRQNYAPFISKCNRFQSNKEKAPQLPTIKPEQKKQESIHNHSRVRDKENDLKSPQFFFKSQIQRFNQANPAQTPSPAHYHPEKSLKNNEHSQNKSPKKLLPPIRTIPAIPDRRNKYGYSFQNKSHSLVSKSVQQLERERFLMKKYQESLTNEKINDSRLKESNSVPRLNELKKQVNKFLANSQVITEKQNKNHHNASLCELGKPKFNHMYEYHPIKSNQMHYQMPNLSQPQQKKQQSNVKFQFFNSSQQRFKTIETEQPVIKEKLGVRHYLSKYLNKANI